MKRALKKPLRRPAKQAERREDISKWTKAQVEEMMTYLHQRLAEVQERVKAIKRRSKE